MGHSVLSSPAPYLLLIRNCKGVHPISTMDPSFSMPLHQNYIALTFCGALTKLCHVLCHVLTAWSVKHPFVAIIVFFLCWSCPSTVSKYTLPTWCPVYPCKLFWTGVYMKVKASIRQYTTYSTSGVQWSLRIKDTLGAGLLSFIQRLSSGGRFKSICYF